MTAPRDGYGCHSVGIVPTMRKPALIHTTDGFMTAIGRGQRNCRCLNENTLELTQPSNPPSAQQVDVLQRRQDVTKLQRLIYVNGTAGSAIGGIALRMALHSSSRMIPMARPLWWHGGSLGYTASPQHRVRDNIYAPIPASLQQC